MDNVFIEPLKRFIERIAAFLPNLLIGLILIIIGFLLAKLSKAIITRVSIFLKVDALSERIGILQALRKSGIQEPLSKMIGQAVYWIIFLSFIIIGLDALKMPAVENLMTEFLLYLPNIVLACIVIFIGYLLGNFLGRAALIASVNEGFAFSGLMGKFVKFTVFIMASTMALELLGIGEDTVLIAFAIVFGGVVLALAIACGLGGKDAAKEYIDKMLQEKKEDDDITHI
jgi:small-conductance mechanosensitive channel